MPLAVVILSRWTLVPNRTAFDFIDHNILLDKFVRNGVPDHTVVWSLDFLNGRKQFIKN